MPDHIKTGSTGELIACNYLSSIGYSIIERNFRVPFGEIDIVAKGPDGTLVIAEVKTLLTSGNIIPEDNLTRSKLLKLSRVASFYANKNPSLIHSDFGFRIDLVTIVLEPSPDSPNLLKIGNNYFAVSHYKNISL